MTTYPVTFVIALVTATCPVALASNSLALGYFCRCMQVCVARATGVPSSSVT